MSEEPNRPFLVASVQATPVFLDLEATVEKACSLIAEAGAKGARLAVFPEGFIPAYPLWAWFVPAGETRMLRDLYAELHANAVTVPDATTERLGRAAREAGTAVVMGVNERNAEASGSTLYNTLLFIGPDGRLLGKHRKLVPTAGERLIHAQGDGSTLRVHHLGFARLSGLVCWENYMPLARYALWAQGAQIHVAPTWDRGEPWISTLRHIAKEGRVFVLGSCSPVRRDSIPDRHAFKQRFLPEAEWINPGDSAIVDPDGKFLAEPVRNRESILYAEIDPAAMIGPRWQLDVAGHYGRPDVFDFAVRRDDRAMMRVVAPEEEGSPGAVAPGGRDGFLEGNAAEGERAKIPNEKEKGTAS
jgi:nitrilase